MMKVPQSYNFGASPYKDMAAATDLAQYKYSSVSCTDFTVPASAGAPGAVPGLNNFSAKLKSGYGTTVSPSGCGKTVICKSGATNAACSSANSFMKVKQDLRGPGIMKCKTFKTATGVKCDVKNMVKNAGANKAQKPYINDCVGSDGKIQTLDYACDIDEFTTLM